MLIKERFLVNAYFIIYLKQKYLSPLACNYAALFCAVKTASIHYAIHVRGLVVPGSESGAGKLSLRVGETAAFRACHCLKGVCFVCGAF